MRDVLDAGRQYPGPVVVGFGEGGSATGDGYGQRRFGGLQFQRLQGVGTGRVLAAWRIGVLLRRLQQPGCVGAGEHVQLHGVCQVYQLAPGHQGGGCYVFGPHIQRPRETCGHLRQLRVAQAGLGTQQRVRDLVGRCGDPAYALQWLGRYACGRCSAGFAHTAPDALGQSPDFGHALAQRLIVQAKHAGAGGRLRHRGLC